MTKWQCGVCGYIFDGEEAPEKCPKCGASKEEFEKLDENTTTLVERSRFSNSLHMELHTLLERAKEICEKGIEDNLDPGCVKLFEAAKAYSIDIQQRIKAELRTHMSKNKWG